jgi:hypothetical protein
MKKHIVHVGVGPDLPPNAATAYLAKVEEAFTKKNFFPHGTVVFMANRSDNTYVETVAVDGF